MAAVGIIGASGFTGAELLRLCAAHPDLDVVVATGDSQAGTAVADLYPSLAAHYGDLTFAEVDDTTADGCDVVFLGLPHGASQALVPDLASRVGHVIDLAADFRLRDAALYPEWYDEPHTAPGLLVDFAYGLPELYRPSIVGAPLIAVPGCYPTATSLALAPFVWGGHVEPSGLVVDAASGVSGAGRPPKPHTTFCAVDEDYSAYGLVGHRHTPEMEQAVGTRADGSVVDHVSILFTPHLAPMNRGILATTYVKGDPQAVLNALQKSYADEPFIEVLPFGETPSTHHVRGSNFCHIGVTGDRNEGRAIVVAALDNLTKGSSGQALQNANLMLGEDETAGLMLVPCFP